MEILNLNELEGMIFDVDGTLVDSLGQSYEVDRRLVGRYGGHIPDLDSYREAIGMGDWDRFYERFGIKDPKIKKRLLEDYYEETARVPLKAVPAAEELLAYLRERVPISIVSINKSVDKVIEKLRKTGLEKYFDGTAIQVTPDKKTEGIRKECERQNIPYSKAIFVGDTAKDVVEARDAGTKTVAIAWEGSYHNERMIVESQPDLVFSSLKDFCLAIRQENSNYTCQAI